MGSRSEPKLNADELWREYLKGRANNNGAVYKNLLVEVYRDIPRYAAERLHRKLPCSVELDDLISAGVKGLEDALEDFNPLLNVKFETYSSARVKGAILDYLRGIDWAPQNVRGRARLIERIESRIMLETGWKPTDSELLEELSKDKYKDHSIESKGIKKAKIMLRDSRIKPLTYYEQEKRNNDGGKEILGINYVRDKKAINPATELQKKETRELLTKELTRAEKLIVILYYSENMKMKEIGKCIGVNEQRVSQMHASILARLKSMLTAKRRKSRELMEDFTYS